MKVTYQDEIRQSPELSKLTERATKLLGEVLRESSDLVIAEWGRAPTTGGPALVSLKLTDFTAAEETAQFTGEELAQPHQLRRRLVDLWGDVLQIRSHKLLQELKNN